MNVSVAKQYKWESLGGNYVLRIDKNHYISYNPNTSASHFGAMLDSIIGESGEETALVDTTNPGHKFRILRGDWRARYEQLAPQGFEDCVDFFYTKCREFGGEWSTHELDRASYATDPASEPPTASQASPHRPKEA